MRSTRCSGTGTALVTGSIASIGISESTPRSWWAIRCCVGWSWAKPQSERRRATGRSSRWSSSSIDRWMMAASASLRPGLQPTWTQPDSRCHRGPRPPRSWWRWPRRPGSTRRTLAFIPGLAPFTELQADVMVQMSKAANRPIMEHLSGNGLNNRDLAEAALSSTSTAPQRGARVVALAFPGQMESFYTLVSTFPLTGLPGWSDTMQLPLAQRIVALQDPGVRSVWRRAPRLQRRHGDAGPVGRSANRGDIRSRKRSARRPSRGGLAAARGRRRLTPCSTFRSLTVCELFSVARQQATTPPHGSCAAATGVTRGR